MKRLFSALAILLIAAATPASATSWKDPNTSDAKPYRLFKYFPDCRVRSYNEKRFDSFQMVTGYEKVEPKGKVTTERLEGHIIRYNFQCNPEISALEFMRNYENLLTSKGFTTIMSGYAKDFNEIQGFPKLDSDDTYGAWKWQEPGKGMIYIQVEARSGGGPNDGVGWVDIVETQKMEQKLEADAGTMMDALQKTGHVAVYGINFDTAKATIKPDSDPVLQQVLLLLTRNSDLRVSIEGHTDNAGAGSFDNKKLSENRAGSVKFWLVGHGVDADRLDTAGFGDSRPVADNATEDGKAKNRRVELVRE